MSKMSEQTTPEGWVIDGYTAAPTFSTECPYCDSENTQSTGCMHTIVGYMGGPMDDGNHFTEGRRCLDCGKGWTREWVPRDQSVWLADENKVVLVGEAGCCETLYGHLCSCGGVFFHSRKGKTISYGFTRKGPDNAMYYRCDSCGTVESDPCYPNHMEGSE